MRKRVARAGAAWPLVLLLAGCSGGESTADAGSGVTASSVDVDRRTAAEAQPLTSAAPGAPGRVPVQTRQVISTGRVTLEADDLEAVRDELDRLLGTYGGHVAKERTSKDEDGAAERSELEVRVPSRHFEQLMSNLEGIGTVTEAGRKAVDVTTEVIDVDARIRTQEVSLDRLHGFLGEASDVNAMIRLEAEIARREAELASLRAQQDYLADQTSLATISVTMTRDHRRGARSDDPLAAAGFVSGLREGWGALVSVLLVGATVAGAVIPFALVLAVVGVPLWLWVRATRRRRSTPASAESPVS